MAYARKDYAGAAAATTVSGSLAVDTTSITIASSTGWPSGSNGPFMVVIDEGTASEEKVLITSRSGTTLTVSDRGYDDTTAATHDDGATISHCYSAEDADEANYWVAELSGAIDTAGDIPVADGNNSLTTLAKGSNSTVLQVSSGGTLQYGTVTSAMIADGTIVNADVNASAAIAHDKLDIANQIDESDLTTSVAGDGLTGGNGTALAVVVDDATIQNDGTLAVKDGGIDEDALAASIIGDGLTGAAGTALSVVVDDSTIQNDGTLAVKADGIGMSHIALGSDPSGDTDAVRKSYLDVIEAQSVLGRDSQEASWSSSGATTDGGATVLATVTITDPGYDIYVWGHATLACYATSVSTWDVWSLVIKVDNVTKDRLDVPFVNISGGTSLGLSVGVPLRSIAKSTGSNTTVKMAVYRQLGTGTLHAGGNSTTNNLQVYWARQ